MENDQKTNALAWKGPNKLYYMAYILVVSRERPFKLKNLNPVLSKRVMNEELWVFLSLIRKFRSRAYIR